jgi:putative ATP-dependent endonuclease of OLD family
MKIKNITVKNFKSVYDESIDFSTFNILVGRNNCGKTNFFDAIQFFYTGLARGQNINDLKFKRDSSLNMSVKITFSDIQHGAEKMKNKTNRTKILGLIEGHSEITIERNSTNPKKRIVYLAEQEVKPGTGFDSALNDFLPKFEYISTKQYYDSVAKYGKSTPIGIMLSGVVAAILEESKQYRQFQNKFSELFEHDESEIKAQFETIGANVKIYLEKQFPDCTKVSFEVAAPAFDDLLKNFDTIVDDGVETYADEKGDGMQRALMLAIIQAFADFRKNREDAGKTFLFFIDEAELHLHPTAQRKLKDVLHQLSVSNDQVFINTHSSVFVADNYDGQSIYQVTKEDQKTKIAQVSDFDKPYIVFELLGGSPADLLLPKNFLIVEGVSEFELITRIIRRFYSESPPIQIIEAKGDVDQAERTINAIEKLFTPINKSIYQDRVVLLFDQPSTQTAGGVRQFHENYPHLNRNNQVFELPVRDLEQYYPNHVCHIYGNWRKSQQEMDAVNSSGKKIINGKKKRQLAKYVGDHITQDQFENDMNILYQSLQRCWELTL